MQLTRQQLLEVAFREGNLAYQLRSYQMALYQVIWLYITNPMCLKAAITCARRFGKSHVLMIVAIEFALRFSGALIRFGAPTQKMLKKINLPIIRTILRECPQHLQPKPNKVDGVWYFKNGSEIHIAGLDGGNVENLRGQKTDLGLIDEAGFTDDLKYAINDVLLPQTIDTSGAQKHGTLLAATTPPKQAVHDYNDYEDECIAKGFRTLFTVNANTSLDQATKDLYAQESGGYDSATYRREYLCERVTDLDLMIVREWQDRYVQTVLCDQAIDIYWDRYVSMDIGVLDFTALIYGYYNFLDAKLYIQKELTLNGSQVNSEDIYRQSFAIETELLFRKNPCRVIRVSDSNDPDLIADLGIFHKYHFTPTTKESLDAMVNQLRLWVQEGRIIIDPSCKMLIGCLKYGIWDDKHKQFARSKIYKHFDHLAALIYLVRNIQKNHNPVPVDFNYSKTAVFPYKEEWEIRKNTSYSVQTARSLEKALGLDRFRRKD